VTQLNGTRNLAELFISGQETKFFGWGWGAETPNFDAGNVVRTRETVFWNGG